MISGSDCGNIFFWSKVGLYLFEFETDGTGCTISLDPMDFLGIRYLGVSDYQYVLCSIKKDGITLNDNLKTYSKNLQLEIKCVPVILKKCELCLKNRFLRLPNIHGRRQELHDNC